MKLNRAEVFALALTVAFLAAALGWHFGTRRSVPAFSVTTAAAPETVTAARSLPEPATAEKAADTVDLNTATAEELATLSGIGQTLAGRIIAWREENGPFRRVEDLVRVRGIGVKILEANLGRLTVGGPEEDTDENTGGR